MSLQQQLARPEIAPLLREGHSSADEGAQEMLVLELYRRGAMIRGALFCNGNVLGERSRT